MSTPRPAISRIGQLAAEIVAEQNRALVASLVPNVRTTLEVITASQVAQAQRAIQTIAPSILREGIWTSRR